MDDLKNLTDKELLALRQATVNNVARNNNLQMAAKIKMNSVYGALANLYFRFYNQLLAESITLSGQLAIRWIAKEMNEYMNKLFQTEGVDYIIAIDTDSIYINFESITELLPENMRTTENIVNIIDKFAHEKVEPFMDQAFGRLAKYTNAYDQKMVMKREAIANKGIWTAKKRYILNLYDLEGVRYKEPKLKMMGIEAVRSSTPMSIRENIKKALGIIMNEDEAALQRFIEDFRIEFRNLEFEEVAFPRGIHGIDKYADKQSVYKSGCPMHVRAALLYNKLVIDKKLENKYALIKESDKIKFCYLKMPNPLRENVIAAPDSLPRQFGLNQYIDYETQFDKAFLEPLKTILNAIGWQTEKQNTLDAFFS